MLGFILILFVGPSFFYLIKVSLEKGFLYAVAFAVGIILSDLILISLIYLGFSTIFESTLFQKIFSVIATIVLLSLGIITYRSQHANRGVSVNLESDHFYLWYFFKGVLINGVNPFTFMIWIGVVGGMGLGNSYTDTEFRYFFSGLLSTILIADILKAYAANRIKAFMNEKLIRKVNRILAIIFIILAARMAFYFLSLTFGY